MSHKLQCILHGSLRQHYDLFQEVHSLFTRNDINVLAPHLSKIIGETNGFIHFQNDGSKDPRVQELLYLKKLTELGSSGFSYYLNPQGRVGTSTSYELAMDQVTNTRTLFMEKLLDHPVYIPQNSVWKPQELVDYVQEHGYFPPSQILQREKYIQRLMQDLILPGSLIAVGAIIVDDSKKYKPGQEQDILLVKTHKWGGRYSIIGGKVKRNERLAEALGREIREETGLKAGIGESICTFDELQNSGYHEGYHHRVFTDNVANVRSRKVKLNEEAQEYLWIPPTIALKELMIEPNARKTVKLYTERHLRVAGHTNLIHRL